MSLNTILATAPLTSTGFHLKANGTTLGNSLIWDNGTNVGIGNTNTSYTLDVTGTLRNTTSAYFATASGSVGIGTTSPASPLTINATAGAAQFNITRSEQTNQGFSIQAGGGETTFNSYEGTNSVFGEYVFKSTKGSTTVERMRINGSGNVGIGTSSPVSTNLVGSMTIVKSYSGDTPTSTTAQNYYNNQSNLYLFGRNAGLTMVGNANEECVIAFASPSSEYIGAIRYETESTSAGGSMKFQTGGANERMRITSGGNVNINGSGFSDVKFYVKGSDATSSNYAALFVNGSASNLFNIRNDGAVQVFGSLSKGSGSFRIDHPLESMTETHQLVHSFIEGPRVDLIYRGKLTLVNGKAQANIDEMATMTKGTFEALCREVQCFTTNESGWDLVKGKVIDNIIYIESQNINSTDEISWMVIGERKDKHIIDTDWTDDNGKVIVEPLKPSEPITN